MTDLCNTFRLSKKIKEIKEKHSRDGVHVKLEQVEHTEQLREGYTANMVCRLLWPSGLCIGTWIRGALGRI